LQDIPPPLDEATETEIAAVDKNPEEQTEILVDWIAKVC